jgi:hypothetical protein
MPDGAPGEPALAVVEAARVAARDRAAGEAAARTVVGSRRPGFCASIDRQRGKQAERDEKHDQIFHGHRAHRLR